MIGVLVVLPLLVGCGAAGAALACRDLRDPYQLSPMARRLMVHYWRASGAYSARADRRETEKQHV